MASTLQPARGGTRKDDGQWRVIVLVCVAHGAAVQNDRMIKQISVCFLNRLQLLKQIGECADMVTVQHRKSIHVLFQVRVMRQNVEGITHAALRIDGVTEFFRHEQSRNARDVGLPRQNPQVEHQLDVLFEIFGNTCRRRRHVQIA